LTAYAYWLREADAFGLSSTLRDQVSILEAVTKFAPNDKAAWHNLAAAASGLVKFMPDWAGKLQMSRTAVSAFQQERQLTGQTNEPPDTPFLAVNPATAPHDLVCNYIADFFNKDPEARYGRGGHRRLDMFGFPNPVDIAGDGHLVYVYTVEDNDQSYLAASPNPVTETETRNIVSRVDFKRPEGAASGDVTRAYVVPFRDGYYVLYERNGIPIDVVKPNKGPVCSFKTDYAPFYELNQRPALCAQAGSGATYTRIPLNLLPPDTQSPFDLSGQSKNRVQLRGVQDATLPDGTRTEFVSFDDMGPSGENVCPSSGVTYLDSSTNAAKMRAEQLAMMERDTVGGCWSSAFLVDVNGETMVDIEAKRPADGRPASRALLQFTADGAVPVCLIKPQPRYVSQPAP
jgi:hypothetical protein